MSLLRQQLPWQCLHADAAACTCRCAGHLTGDMSPYLPMMLTTGIMRMASLAAADR